jgi:hypothetical protein
MGSSAIFRELVFAVVSRHLTATVISGVNPIGTYGFLS